MWMAIPKKIQVYIIVAATLLLSITIQAGVELVTGAATSPLKFASLIVFLIATAAVTIFNRIWRSVWRHLPFLSKTIFPDLNGTWKGTLHSNYKDPITGQGPGPIETTIWIRQTLLSISVQQQTKESFSRSTRIFVEVDQQADWYRLWFSYDNRPNANVSAMSPDHEGVCWLEIHLSLSDKQMRGQYYTGRSTAGNIQLDRIAVEVRNIPDRAHWDTGSESHRFRSSGN
jgi:hypothetical protein